VEFDCDGASCRSNDSERVCGSSAKLRKFGELWGGTRIPKKALLINFWGNEVVEQCSPKMVNPNGTLKGRTFSKKGRQEGMDFVQSPLGDRYRTGKVFKI